MLLTFDACSNKVIMLEGRIRAESIEVSGSIFYCVMLGIVQDINHPRGKRSESEILLYTPTSFSSSARCFVSPIATSVSPAFIILVDVGLNLISPVLLFMATIIMPSSFLIPH